LRPLNVLVVTIDTLRPDHLHCYGNRNIETPALDGLAQRGALFETAVAQAPLTPPSHASIFTGQYPTVHHVRNTGGFALPPTAHPLASILQKQGWDTAAFVSSVVLQKAYGFDNGFAVYDDQMPKASNRQEQRDEPERRAGATVDRALAWLGGQSGKPWLLWVHLYDAHRPYDPPKELRAKYRDRPYDAEIAYVDQQLGRLFDAVNRKSPANTMVVVLSDHGESLGEHGEFTHGVFLYDSTLRIAFLMAGPGIPAGTRVRQQVRSIDFLPTLLALMGGAPPADVQGMSLTPTFAGKAVSTDVSYGETVFPKIDMGWAELRSIRTGRWKYIRSPRPELYDLAADPGETTNVVAQHPQEARTFEEELRKEASGEEKVKPSVAERRANQLKSLGYMAGGSRQEYKLTGRGADPKDRVGILKLLEQVDSGGLTEAKKITLLRGALDDDATNPRLYYVLGLEFERTDRYREAMGIYEVALAKGIDSATIHSRLAQIALRLGNRDRAIAEYEKSARLDPLDLEVHTNLATAYLEAGRSDDAERVFTFVLQNNASDAVAENGLGLIAIQKRDVTGAQAHFKRAIEADSDQVEAMMNLGLLYEMTGEKEQAQECFRQFLAKASRKQYGSQMQKVRQELARMQ
jgi:choline-sulfatase